MKQPKEPRTIKWLEAELKAERKGAGEYREMLAKDREESVELKKAIEHFKSVNLTLYYACLQERNELLSRMQRIDQRIRALGYLAPGDPKPEAANGAYAAASHWSEGDPE
jgi:hypothetical protein